MSSDSYPLWHSWGGKALRSLQNQMHKEHNISLQMRNVNGQLLFNTHVYNYTYIVYLMCVQETCDVLGIHNKMYASLWKNIHIFFIIKYIVYVVYYICNIYMLMDILKLSSTVYSHLFIMEICKMEFWCSYLESLICRQWGI